MALVVEVDLEAEVAQAVEVAVPGVGVAQAVEAALPEVAASDPSDVAARRDPTFAIRALRKGSEDDRSKGARRLVSC